MLFRIRKTPNYVLNTFIIFLNLTFLNLTFGLPLVYSGELITPFMPAPGTMVNVSSRFTPAALVGMTINPKNPLQFEFLVNRADSSLTQQEKQQEYTKLLKYFLASLTVPDEDQWVNLSPYEHNRIIQESFGKTEMGRDLLEQDYLLKQISSTLLYPESKSGKSFWDKVYQVAYEKLGNTDIPVDTINKVWIVPDQAVVYQSGNQALIVKSHLKVMLEEDYQALASQRAAGLEKQSEKEKISTDLIRQMIIPEIEKEVNEGKNFASLRQVFSGMILATWFKKTLKESLLGQVYADHAKVGGFVVDEKAEEKIYEQYVEALKKGVYNYIKDDVDPYSDEAIPRKYFAGGFHNNLNVVLQSQDVPDGVMSQNIDQIGSSGVLEKIVTVFLASTLTAQALPAPVAYASEVVSQGATATVVQKTNQAQTELTALQVRAEKLKAQLVEVDETIARYQNPLTHWVPVLNASYEEVNGVPTSLLTLGTQGPLGDNGAGYVGLRQIDSRGTSRYDPLSVIDGIWATALDFEYRYNLDNPSLGVNGIVGGTLLQGTMATSRKFQLPEDYYGYSPLNTSIDHHIRGAGLYANLGVQRQFSKVLKGEFHTGANVWALNGLDGGNYYNTGDQILNKVYGASANAKASWGGSLTYQVSPGETIQPFAYREFDYSHRDYSAEFRLGNLADAYMFIPIGNAAGIRYTLKGDVNYFQVEAVRTQRPYQQESQVNLSYGAGSNSYSLNYNHIKSQNVELPSQTNMGLRYSHRLGYVGQDAEMVFSAQFWGSRNTTPSATTYTSNGVLLSLDFYLSPFRFAGGNAEIRIAKGQADVKERVQFNPTWAHDYAEDVEFYRFALNFLLKDPYERQLYLSLPISNLDPKVVAIAQTAEAFQNGLNTRDYPGFINTLATRLNQLPPDARGDQALGLTSYFLSVANQVNLAQTRSDQKYSQDMNVLFADVQKAMNYHLYGGQKPTFTNFIGSPEQFASTFAADLAKATGGNWLAHPTGMNRPVRDDQGKLGFSQYPYTVFKNENGGISFISSNGTVFTTGAKDLLTARSIWARVVGVPQLYVEVTDKDGKHIAYMPTAEGKYIGSLLFPKWQGNSGYLTSEYFRRISEASFRGVSSRTVPYRLGDIASQRLSELTTERQKIQAELRGVFDQIERYQYNVSPAPSPSQPNQSSADKASSNVGGINMNAANLDLIIKRDDHGVALPASQQDLEAFGRIEGLVPQILDIQPYLSSIKAAQ